MGFFKRHSGRASYNLLANYNHFMPGYLDLLWIVILMALGAFIGSYFVEIFSFGGLAQDAQTYGMLIAYPLTFIPAMIFASVKSRQNEGFEDGYAIDNRNFGSHRGITMAFAATVLILAAAIIIEPVGILLPEMPEEMKEMLEILLEGPVWVSFISASIFAPFFEEWLCRGIILRGMLKKTRPAWAILISALFFALIHMNLWQAVPAFLIGLVFGYVYYKTGSLKLTMLMHFVNNTLVLVLSNIPSLKDTEYIWEALSPWAYGGLYVLAIIALISGIILIKSLPQKEGDLGGCRKIASLL